MRLLAIALLVATSTARAAQPRLDCSEVEVQVPAEADDKERPKGFQWSGYDVVGVLADGRALLSRDASLEGLSRRVMKVQYEMNNPDRVMQLIAVDKDGTLSLLSTTLRGTVVEAASLPGGGVVVVRSGSNRSVLEYIDASGRLVHSSPLPEDPQSDKQWRYYNALKGTAPARVHVLSQDKASVWHNGRSVFLDLRSGAALAAPEAWPLGLPVVYGKRSDGELMLVNRHRDLLRFDTSGKVVETTPCPDCRVVAVGPSASGDVALNKVVALVKAEGSTLLVRWQRFGGKSSGKEFRLTVPQGIDGRTWSWALRPGPARTALIAASDNTREATQHVVWALTPGSQEPTWTYELPADLAKPGERLVADAVGPWVRLRLTQGEGSDEVLRLVALIDMSSDERTDWMKPSSLQEPLRRMVAAPFHADGHRDGGLLRVAEDPLFQRLPVGPSTARFEWCKVVIED
ncbi:MAG: hypothetical protein ACI9MC_003537 [Kiritimatiellia bacterium]|jgi:hypothetical protein